MTAQQFSTRNDFNDAGQADGGLSITHCSTGYRVVQFGYPLGDPYFQICFDSISPNGIVHETGWLALDTVASAPGFANGPTLHESDLYIFGSTDNGSQDKAVAWRFNDSLELAWSNEVYSDTVDAAVGRMTRVRDGKFAGSGGVWHPGENGQMFLVLLDTSGGGVQTFEYGNSLRNEAFALDTCPDGGYILAGWIEWSSTENDYEVIKVDGSGTQQWVKHLGGDFYDGVFINVITSSDSEYVVVGADGVYQSGFTTYYRLYAARLDAGGDVVWERAYGNQGIVNGLYSVTELQDGSFLAAGLFDVSGGDKGVLLKFAPNGDSLWMRTYRHPPLDTVFSVHWLYHAIEDPDGSIVATGSCNDGQQDLWVIRVDSFGCLVPGCQLYDAIAEQPPQPDKPQLNILLYPNPASDRLYISFRSAKEPTGEFRLFDAQGTLVRKFKPGGKSEEIDLNVGMHPAGVYILSYVDRKGERWAERVVMD